MIRSCGRRHRPRPRPDGDDADFEADLADGWRRRSKPSLRTGAKAIVDSTTPRPDIYKAL